MSELSREPVPSTGAGPVPVVPAPVPSFREAVPTGSRSGSPVAPTGSLFPSLEGNRGPNRRTASLWTCRCGEPVLTGLDDDHCAFTATCDPYRLTALGEVEALRDGRWTYQLVRRSLDRRDQWNIPGHPPTVDLPVLAEHRCGQPIPADWIAPPAPRQPRPMVEDF